MGTSPASHLKATGTIGKGDASQRSIARSPVSNLPVKKSGACLQQCQIQSSARNRAMDCTIVRTSPAATLGTQLKKSFPDAALRTPVGTLVSTKPPSSVKNQQIKQDASQRSTKPTQDASQKSPLASFTASTVATPSETRHGCGASQLSMASPLQTHCGGDASQRSSLMRTHTRLDQQSLSFGTVVSPCDVCCGGNASQRSLSVSTTASPSEARCGGDASQRSLIVTTFASPLEAPCAGMRLNETLPTA